MTSYDYEYCRSLNREYTYSFPIDDIPNFNYLYIRDGNIVFKTDKHTGEICEQMSLSQYVSEWRGLWQTNSTFKEYYTQGYTFPKEDPDTSKDIDELRKRCSDSTRHKKGNTEYIIDFLTDDSLTITEVKLLKFLISKVEVWNYTITTYQDIASSLGKDTKWTKKVIRGLEEKGLAKVLNLKFFDGTAYSILFKVHPKLYWKGRWSAFAHRVGLQDEYEIDPRTESI